MGETDDAGDCDLLLFPAPSAPNPPAKDVNILETRDARDGRDGLATRASVRSECIERRVSLLAVGCALAGVSAATCVLTVR